MSSDAPISILIVDDHPVVRDGVHVTVSAESDMVVAGEASTGAEAVSRFKDLRPDIVLMDLLLPDMDGAEATKQICEYSCTAQVIILTTLCGDEEIYRALEAGARGYLFKDMVRRELVQAIRKVHTGGRFIPTQVGARIAENLPRPNLTSREVEVLEQIAGGLRTKEIAFKLNVAESTINAHIKRILEKLNSADRTHAIITALRRGIIRL